MLLGPAGREHRSLLPPSIRQPARVVFNRYFYKLLPMRTLAKIRADILALAREADGLLGEITRGGKL